MNLRILDGLGFSSIVKIKTNQLVFDSKFRKYCEENYCGNYGKNYACPPDCGTPLEMKRKALSYENAIVFYREYRLDDIMDKEAVKLIEVDNRDRMQKAIFILDNFLKEVSLTKEGQGSVIGSCHNCEVCNKVKDLPCSNPKKIYSCLSAYCINVDSLAKTCNMVYRGKDNVYGIFGLYFYN